MQSSRASNRQVPTFQQLVRVLLAPAVVAASGGSSYAALAKRLGQPISSYSASLFGKTGLSATQTQVLTSDPDEPLFGSTSVGYDPQVVGVEGFGFGPGYGRWTATPEKYLSGAAIELLTMMPVVTDTTAPADTAAAAQECLIMADLAAYLNGQVTGQETGYLQLYWQLNNPEIVGKYTPDGFIPLGSNAPIPGGVDTHFFEFQYRDGIPNSVDAFYTVFDDLGGRPSGNTVDFMASGDPQNPDITTPGEIRNAVISGTIPEPASATLALLAAGWVACRRGIPRRRR